MQHLREAQIGPVLPDQHPERLCRRIPTVRSRTAQQKQALTSSDCSTIGAATRIGALVSSPIRCKRNKRECNALAQRTMRRTVKKPLFLRVAAAVDLFVHSNEKLSHFNAVYLAELQLRQGTLA